MVLYVITCVLMREAESLDTDRKGEGHRTKGNVKMRQIQGGMATSQGTPQNAGSLRAGRGKDTFSHRASGGTVALLTP